MSGIDFAITSRDGRARAGVLRLPRGEIRTPAFMPVGTAATVKAMLPESVRATGADVLLGNTYHLMLRPGAERVARLGGLHRFMGWERPILTDSGGFQVMSLAGLRKLADGRLCSPGPMQYGVTAALRGDRTFQVALRDGLRERADITTERLNAIPGMTCVRPEGAFYAMPQVALPPGRTDQDYVLGLLRATGVLTVFGSGFGTDPAIGAFRVVFLAQPAELHRIYDLVAEYTGEFLAGRTA